MLAGSRRVRGMDRAGLIRGVVCCQFWIQAGLARLIGGVFGCGKVIKNNFIADQNLLIE